ncbi:MAG: endonuclease V [Thermogutta sp.]
MPDSFDITEPPDLEADLRRLIAAVPPGRVTTCGALAECLGDRSAAVWIGRWLLNHSHTEECGCHRVVRAGGMLGGYAGGEQDKIARLQSEGALLPLGDWNARALFSADELRLALPVPPLAKLRERQEAVRQAVVLRPPARPPEYLGGVDASYGPSGEAVAAYCHVRRRDGRVLERIVIRRECRFPYISGYLAFRELPVMLAAVAEARRAGLEPDLLLVDGAGVLHPREAGLASHLGVTAGLPTVGVTKTLLCGTLPEGEPRRPGTQTPITWHGATLGACLRSQSGHARCVYVSPGHLIDPAAAAEWTMACFRRRLPEPIYWADRLSREESRKSG